MNKQFVILLSFDVEEFDIPEEYGVKVTDEERIAVSRDGMSAILDALEACNAVATMFLTVRFAETCPELLRMMVAGGHEIASHGVVHTGFQAGDLVTSRKRLEELSGQPVCGFRMPRLGQVSKDEMLAAGYGYESSVNPVWLPGRYCNCRKPLLPYREECGLWQFPISAVPGVRFPLFWLSFKNLPLWLYARAALYAAHRTGYFNMYSHPWEYNSKAAERQWNLPRYITRHAGVEQAERLKRLLLTFREAGGEFRTFSQAMDIFRK